MAKSHDAGVNQPPTLIRRVNRLARVRGAIERLKAYGNDPAAKAKLLQLQNEEIAASAELKAVRDALNSMELA